jgi:uncharacterized membrane protein
MMKHPLVPLGLLILLVTIQTAGAQDALFLGESTSYVEISENSGHERIVLNYVVMQAVENALRDSIYIPGDLSNVTVRGARGTLTPYENVRSFNTITLYLPETVKEGDRCVVTIEFDKATTTVNTSYWYEVSYVWGTTPVSVHIVATLSGKYVRYTTDPPEDDTSIEENKLQLRWYRVQENRFRATITFGKKAVALENQGGEQSVPALPLPSGSQPPITSPYVFLLVTVAACLVTTGALLKVRPRLGARVPPKIKRPRAFSKEDVRRLLSMLTEHERKVMGVLLKRDNLTQRILCEQTSIPKATMSRVLQRLENKGIITRTGIGASKRVLLTRWARRWKRK